MEQDFESELHLAFGVFDANDDGIISAAELRNMLTTLGERMTDAVSRALGICGSHWAESRVY